MANRIVKDSANWASIWVKEVQVLAAGGDVATLPAVNSLWAGSGAKVGLIGDTPYKGQDGAYYATVDMAALVRLSGVTGTYTDGQAIYVTPGGAITGTVSTNVRIGFADRPKTASGAGDLWVQLTPQSA